MELSCCDQLNARISYNSILSKIPCFDGRGILFTSHIAGNRNYFPEKQKKKVCFHNGGNFSLKGMIQQIPTAAEAGTRIFN